MALPSLSMEFVQEAHAPRLSLENDFANATRVPYFQFITPIQQSHLKLHSVEVEYDASNAHRGFIRISTTLLHLNANLQNIPQTETSPTSSPFHFLINSLFRPSTSSQQGQPSQLLNRHGTPLSSTIIIRHGQLEDLGGAARQHFHHLLTEEENPEINLPGAPAQHLFSVFLESTYSPTQEVSEEELFRIYGISIRLNYQRLEPSPPLGGEGSARSDDASSQHSDSSDTTSSDEADRVPPTQAPVAISNDFFVAENIKYDQIVTILRQLPLPDELLLNILRLAGLHRVLGVATQERIDGIQNANQEYLRLSYPENAAPNQFSIMDGLEIRCASKDQGWATSEGSWTWGEASIVEGEAEITPRYQVFRNPRASRNFEHHRFQVDGNHELCRQFQPGRHLVLWVRSCFPGWRVFTSEASVVLKYH